MQILKIKKNLNCYFFFKVKINLKSEDIGIVLNNY